MDMANLDKSQQAAVLDQQFRQQRLLSDQAANNAALQFNATSENQTNQFMANLGQQAELLMQPNQMQCRNLILLKQIEYLH